MTNQPYRVLVLLSPKKLGKLNLLFGNNENNKVSGSDIVQDAFITPSPSPPIVFTFVSDPIELVRMNVDWNNFDCFLHKLSDFFNKKESLDEFMDSNVKSVISENVLILDSFSKIEVFYNRISMCHLVEQLCEDYKKRQENENENDRNRDYDRDHNREDSSFCPMLPRTDYSPKSSCYPYGTIWKPFDGCIGDEAHHMILLPSNTANNCILPDHDKFIVQEFIPHHQILYKVYIIGDHVNIILRKSIKGPEEGSHAVDFDSQQLKLISITEQEQMDAWKRLSKIASNGEIERFSRWMRGRLGVNLFGWDLIISEIQNIAYMVDVNVFPGYDDVPDIRGKLIELIDKEGKEWKLALKKKSCQNYRLA